MDDLKSWMCLTGKENPYPPKKCKTPKIYQDYNCNRSKRKEVEVFLNTILVKDIKASEIYKQGEKLGISKSALFRTKEDLGIKHFRMGNVYYWQAIRNVADGSTETVQAK